MRALAALLILAIVGPVACAPAGALGPSLPVPNPLSISLDSSTQEASVTWRRCDIIFTGNVTVQSVPGQKMAVSLEVELDTYWNVSIEPAEMDFTGSGRQNFTANVSVPECELASIDTLVITARAQVAGFTFTAEANATITVKPYYRLQIETEEPYADIQPGGRAIFKLQVWNLGNADDSADVSISYKREGKRAGWETHINTTVLWDIPAGECREVRISVDTPREWDWALHKEELFTFEFVAVSRGATGQGNSSASQSLPIYVYEEGFNMAAIGATLGAVAMTISIVAFAGYSAVKRWRRRRLKEITSKKRGRRSG